VSEWDCTVLLFIFLVDDVATITCRQVLASCKSAVDVALLDTIYTVIMRPGFSCKHSIKNVTKIALPLNTVCQFSQISTHSEMKFKVRAEKAWETLIRQLNQKATMRNKSDCYFITKSAFIWSHICKVGLTITQVK
jgi:hypothetical protein